MPKDQRKRKVRYDGDAIAVGPYLPGVVYEVEEREAERLVSVKGFKYVEDDQWPAKTKSAAET